MRAARPGRVDGPDGTQAARPGRVDDPDGTQAARPRRVDGPDGTQAARPRRVDGPNSTQTARPTRVDDPNSTQTARPTRVEGARQAAAADLIRLYPVLGRLTGRLADEVAAQARPLFADEGSVLFDVDGPCTGFVLILDGEIEVSRPSASGRGLLLYRLSPGDTCVLTVNCLVGHGSYPARAVVKRRVRGLVLPRPMFDRLLAEVPAFRTQMLELFSRRLTRLLTLVEGVAFAPVEQRLAGLLVEQGPQVRATHQELADMLGTAREVVSRQLGAWVDAGIVETSRGLVAVRDDALLRAIAEPLGGL